MLSSAHVECIEVPIDGDMADFKFPDFLALHNMTVRGVSLVEARLLFAIKSIHVKPNGPLTSPDCYTFDVALVFSNQGQSGQLLVDLESTAQHINCQGQLNPPVSDKVSRTLRSAVNTLVITTCLISFVLCARAVLKAQLLKWVSVHLLAVGVCSKCFIPGNKRVLQAPF